MIYPLSEFLTIKSDNYNSNEGFYKLIISSTDANDASSEFAIAMISMGNALNTVHVQRCITSIRSNGRFDGPIYVITDRDDSPYHDFATTQTNVRVLLPPESSWNRSLQVEELRYKRFKTLILDLIKEEIRRQSSSSTTTTTPVQTIVYCDVDLLVGEDLKPFFHYVQQVKQHIRFTLSDGLNQHVNHHVQLCHPTLLHLKKEVLQKDVIKSIQV